MSSAVQSRVLKGFGIFSTCLCVAALGAALWPATHAQAQAVVNNPPAVQPVKLSPAEARKQQIAADTAHLQQLAEELKAEMDKSTKDTLSISVVKKAAEIEKLAHKVREEIRASLVN